MCRKFRTRLVHGSVPGSISLAEVALDECALRHDRLATAVPVIVTGSLQDQVHMISVDQFPSPRMNVQITAHTGVTADVRLLDGSATGHWAWRRSGTSCTGPHGAQAARCGAARARASAGDTLSASRGKVPGVGRRAFAMPISQMSCRNMLIVRFVSSSDVFLLPCGLARAMAIVRRWHPCAALRYALHSGTVACPW